MTDESCDYSKTEEVRCTTALGFRTNYLQNFAPTTVFVGKFDWVVTDVGDTVERVWLLLLFGWSQNM